MSDDETNYSDSAESEQEESVHVSAKKPISVNAIKKIGNYNDDVDDADDDDDSIDNGSSQDDIPDDDDEEEHAVQDFLNADDDADDEDEMSDHEIGDDFSEQNLDIDKKKQKKKQLIVRDEDDEDDEDDYEENYLQKFDNELKKNYIIDYHPECLNHNSDEVSKLSKVIRDENNIIIDSLHKTIPYLTKYEKARVLGQRAKQIETGSKPFVKISENIIDCYVIAELELREKKIPFIIKRPIPGGGFEYWNLTDLEIIDF